MCLQVSAKISPQVLQEMVDAVVQTGIERIRNVSVLPVL
jgi:hypothetical protein